MLVEVSRLKREEMVESMEDRIVLGNNSASKTNISVGFCQIFSDQAKTSLRKISIEIYPDQIMIMLIDFSNRCRRKPMTNCHTLVGFLPVTGDVDRVTKEKDVMSSDLPG